MKFESGLNIPAFEDLSFNTNIGGVDAVALFDKRDNVFSPTKGIYALAEMGRFDDILDGSNDFWSFSSHAYGY